MPGFADGSWVKSAVHRVVIAKLGEGLKEAIAKYDWRAPQLPRARSTKDLN
jgi:hypothetical protein